MTRGTTYAAPLLGILAGVCAPLLAGCQNSQPAPVVSATERLTATANDIKEHGLNTPLPDGVWTTYESPAQGAREVSGSIVTRAGLYGCVVLPLTFPVEWLDTGRGAYIVVGEASVLKKCPGLN